VSSIDLSGALWRKSSYSNGQANCVEATTGAPDGHVVAVRDSKVPAGATLVFAPSAWRRFTGTVKAARIAP
jgi:Domain of unknown function (DUF397)